MSDEMISLGEKLADSARKRPDEIAVTCGEESLTWAQFDARTNRIARALDACGVKQGELVTIGLPNGISFVEALWGIWKVGATPQLISFRLPPAELQAIVDLAQPSLVIAPTGMETSRRRMTVEDLLSLSHDERALGPRVSPISVALTSGGSTGRPKLILSGRPGVTLANPTYPGFYRYGPGDTVLMPGPLYHNGPFSGVKEALASDARVVLMPRFDAEEVLAQIERHKATWIFLVPTMMSRIWRLPKEVRDRYDVSSLRTLWHYAAPCPPWLKEAFIEWLGPDVILELYGGSENQAGTIITGREWLEHRGSVGQVAWGEIKVTDPDGRTAPAGEVGEIYMRPVAGMPASYEYRGATPRALPGGWESLGDIGYFDGDGFLYLSDRRTDMILTGGANVYPAEVEAAIEEHPLVVSSAVIGLPDEDLGERVHAVVQAKPGLSADVLLAHLAERLVTYKLPRSVEFVAEALRDDAGKVRRTQLRDIRIEQMKTIEA